MIRELTITITTSTDTRGDSVTLMIEELERVVEGLGYLEDGKEYKDITGEIDQYGYELHSTYKLNTILE